jgi:hypothetical protein
VCGGDVTELCVVLERDGMARDGRMRGSEWQARVQGGTAAGGATLLGESLLRLACDAGVVPMVVGEQGQVLDVGRRTRTIPPAIRRALRRRDGGCRFPGCTQCRWVDAHHIKHWAHGGETKLGNLVTLCTRHHKAVHEQGFQVAVAGGGGIEFFTPEGVPIAAAPAAAALRFAGTAHSPGRSAHLVARHQRAGLRIEPRESIPRHDGSRLDLHAAVACLMVP